MTNLVERMRRDLMEISYDDIEAMVREAADEIEQLRALLREAVLYDSQIIHMESWWRKVRALEPKP